MTDININIKPTYNSEIKTVTVKTDSKVEDIMKELEKYSIPPYSLVFKGRILKTGEPISSYKISNNATIILVVKRGTENKSLQSIIPSTNKVSQNQEDIINNKKVFFQKKDENYYINKINELEEKVKTLENIKKEMEIELKKNKGIIIEEKMKNENLNKKINELHNQLNNNFQTNKILELENEIKKYKSYFYLQEKN